MRLTKLDMAVGSFKGTHHKKNRNNLPQHQIRVNALNQSEFRKYMVQTERWVREYSK